MCEVKHYTFNDHTIFYIGSKPLTYPTLDECRSYCVYKIEDDTAFLNHIETSPIDRGKGYADKILRYSIQYLKVKKILLDDMSDRPWCKNNLYTKIGFQYVNCYPYPEMIYTKHIGNLFNNDKVEEKKEVVSESEDTI